MKEQEFFYSGMPNRKSVSKEEFKNFIENYPRPLDGDVSGISDPPSITYNDFELANRWPYSIVAHTWAYEDNPGDYFYAPEEDRRYFILENYVELFNNKTGNKA